MRHPVQMGLFGGEQEHRDPDPDDLTVQEVLAEAARTVRDSGLTRGEVGRRCGDRRFVARLLDSPDPSVRRLARLARAMGRRLVVRLE